MPSQPQELALRCNNPDKGRDISFDIGHIYNTENAWGLPFSATQIGKQTVSFIAKWLHEFHVENRLEGDHVFVSFAPDW